MNETQEALLRAMGRAPAKADAPVVRLSPETLAVVRAKAAAGCPLCRCALAAMDPRDNTLRGWPPGTEEAECPVDAQSFHIKGEIGRPTA